ncbi:uncharacterized protein LOC128744279 [Sabethes cyaneus]|uniref:uncharacterized protein LOC128744279 n=1 Tax=Sabethes cyaneus TaxID=53552 RepID=UPI00237ED339|nr:uncharacterized protein LOC128744279 [Sabethes cyaneus]
MPCARPDISYSVGYLGRYQQNPGDLHWQSLKRIVRYLKGTKELKLQYTKKDGPTTLVGFADADWVSDAVDRKSVSGFVFQVFGCTVSWASRKQQMVALSSSEAEYGALSLAVSEGLWLKGILMDLYMLSSDQMFTIYEDNHGCISMAKNVKGRNILMSSTTSCVITSTGEL